MWVSSGRVQTHSKRPRLQKKKDVEPVPLNIHSRCVSFLLSLKMMFVIYLMGNTCPEFRGGLGIKYDRYMRIGDIWESLFSCWVCVLIPFPLCIYKIE